MRILWHSDFGASTGFARVTHGFGERLAEMGHDIHVLGVNWRGWPERETKLKPYFPDPYARKDPYGVSYLAEILQQVKPDLYVCVNDLPLANEMLQIAYGIPRLLYFPVDGTKLPQTWLRPVRQAQEAVTFTHWGRSEVVRCDPVVGTRVGVIPHGVDTTVFRPITPVNPEVIPLPSGQEIGVRTREEIRGCFGIADRFVVLWSDRNTIRKNPELFFRAMQAVCRRHPDVLLWLHCRMQDEGGLMSYWIERYGLTRQTRFTAQLGEFHGVPDALLNAFYNAADVRVSTSLGEGFGLHTIEAAAAGLPQVLPENTCFQEVGGGGGLYVPECTTYPTARGIDLSIPRAGEIADRVEHLYQDSRAWQELAAEGPRHAMAFNWDRLTLEFEQAMHRAVASPSTRISVG